MMIYKLTEVIIEFMARLMALMVGEFVMDGVSIGALFLLGELGVIVYVYVLHRGAIENNEDDDDD